MIEGKQQQIESRKRKYGQGKYNSGAQQKPPFTPNLPTTMEAIPTMEAVHITTVASRMETGM